MTRKKEDKIPKPDGKLEKPVILIGMMGAGKSSIGKMLAAHIGAHFIDSDTEIEKAAKMTIPEIFKLHGEAYFRDGEKRVFKRLLEGQPAIIAAGGGAFAHTPTREIILESGFSIWLKVNRETLIRRVSKRPEKRPLLAKGNIEQTISRLMEERYPVYAEADIMVESDDGKRPQTVKVISEILANQGILNRSDET
ncbi:MAG: shikimate kinase [Candidatus Micropelagos thuwalensis]